MSIQMKNGCLVYYGNLIGYQAKNQTEVTVDPQFRREELESWLARRGLVPRWEEGVYLSDVEQSRRPAPEGDFVERISRYLDLSKTDHERLLDLAAKSRNRISADLPEYIMQKDIVRAALRVSKDVNATDEEWQAFIEQMKNRPR